MRYIEFWNTTWLFSKSVTIYICTLLHVDLNGVFDLSVFNIYTVV